MTSKVQRVLTLEISNLLTMFDLDFDPEKYFSVLVRTLSLSQQDIIGYFFFPYVYQFMLEMVLMVRMIRFDWWFG